MPHHALGKHLAGREQRRSGVKLPVLDTLDQLATPPVCDLHLQIREALLQGLQGIEQHCVAHGLRHAEAQGAGGRGIFGHQLMQRIDLAHHALAAFVHTQADGRGFHGLGVAIEEDRPQ